MRIQMIQCMINKCRFVFMLLMAFIVVSFLPVEADEGQPNDSAQVFQFDFKNFFGEKLLLDSMEVSHLKQVRLSLVLPPNHRLLPEASPYVQIFSLDGSFQRKFLVRGDYNAFSLDLDVAFDKLFAEVALFYCKKGEEGMCLMKKILYEIPFKKSGQQSSDDLVFKVDIADEVY